MNADPMRIRISDPQPSALYENMYKLISATWTKTESMLLVIYESMLPTVVTCQDIREKPSKVGQLQIHQLQIKLQLKFTSKKKINQILTIFSPKI